MAKQLDTAPFYTQSERWRSFLMTNSSAFRELCAERERGWHSSALDAWYAERRAGAVATTPSARSTYGRDESNRGTLCQRSTGLSSGAESSSTRKRFLPKTRGEWANARSSTESAASCCDGTANKYNSMTSASAVRNQVSDTIFDGSDVHVLSERYRAHMRSIVAPIAPQLFVAYNDDASNDDSSNNSNKHHSGVQASSSLPWSLSASQTVFRSNRVCIGSMRRDAVRQQPTRPYTSERKPNAAHPLPRVNDATSSLLSAPSFLDLGCAPGGVSKFLVMDLHWRGVGVTLSRAEAGIDVDHALRSSALAPYFTLLEGNVTASPRTWRCRSPRQLTAIQPNKPSLCNNRLSTAATPTGTAQTSRTTFTDDNVTGSSEAERDTESANVGADTRDRVRRIGDQGRNSCRCPNMCSRHEICVCGESNVDGESVMGSATRQKFFFVNGGAVQDFGQRQLGSVYSAHPCTENDETGASANTARRRRRADTEACAADGEDDAPGKRARDTCEMPSTTTRENTPVANECNGSASAPLQTSSNNHILHSASTASEIREEHAIEEKDTAASLHCSTKDIHLCTEDSEGILPWFTLFAPQLRLALEHVVDGGAMMLVYGAPQCASFFILLAALDAFVGPAQTRGSMSDTNSVHHTSTADDISSSCNDSVHDNRNNSSMDGQELHVRNSTRQHGVETELRPSDTTLIKQQDPLQPAGSQAIHRGIDLASATETIPSTKSGSAGTHDVAAPPRNTLTSWIVRKGHASAHQHRTARIVETMHIAKTPVYVIWQNVHTSGRAGAQRRLIESLQARSTTLSPMDTSITSDSHVLQRLNMQERLRAKRQFWLGESDDGFALGCDGFARHRTDIESIWTRTCQFLRTRRERAERALAQSRG